MSNSRPPKYSRSKEKSRPDRAYVWLDGKKKWLGRYGTSESHAKYLKLITGKADEVLERPTEPTISGADRGLSGVCQDVLREA